jgi:hypothetical protein
MSGVNRIAVDATLEALRALGRLESVDDALVALCRSTADAVDSSPGRATLIKEYRECLVLLREVGPDAGDSDIERLFAALRDPTERVSAEPA